LKAELAKIDDPDELARVCRDPARGIRRRKERGAPTLGQTILVCDQPIEWNMIHFDVQLIGGTVLHEGKIAEMATGEGKTLVATGPIYLTP
jgi:hypothetical protein